MINFNTSHTEQDIDINLLTFDKLYHRPIDRKRAQKIADNYQSIFQKQPIVNFRDGKYFVIDGLQTIEALKLLGKRTVNVKIADDSLTQMQEIIISNTINALQMA
jgi:ParB-like chromosome segregation protein Spo0J